MSANENIEKVETAGLSPQASQLITQAIASVFEAEAHLTVIGKMLDELDPQKVGDAFPALKLVLESLGSFFQGMQSMQSSSSWAEAQEHFKVAVIGFGKAGQDELRLTAFGLGSYASAAAELQASNITLGRQLVAQASECLRKAGKTGRKFAPLIDRMHAEHLFIQGVQAVKEGDFDKAQSLIEQAAQAAQKVAHDYFEPETTAYLFWSGHAHHYRAYYTVNRAFNDFTLFNYESLEKELNLTEDALQVKELLSKIKSGPSGVKDLLYSSEGNIELLDLLTELANIMRRALNSTFTPDPQTYNELRRRFRRASASFGQLGEQGIPMIRLCAQLSDQVSNLERLAKITPVEIAAAGPSIREKAAYESFERFQEAALQSLSQPLRQLQLWSMLSVILVTLSVALIIAGAAGTLFWNTQVGLLTSISSILTSLISSVLYFQLRLARNEVNNSRAAVLQHFKDAGERFFAETPAIAVFKKNFPASEGPHPE